MKSDFRHKPPAPKADQDAAWAKVVRALSSSAPASDDDLPEGDDLPDDDDGHLVMALGDD